MSFVSALIANVARRSADFAKWSGVLQISPVRSVGVRIMEAVVPSDQITIRVRDDIQMRVNPAEDGRWYYFADQDIVWGDSPDPWMVDELDSGDTFLDIGAHVGYFSLIARNAVGAAGSVYSFEPHPKNYERLVENIELNGFNNIIPEQLAAAEGSGSVNLFESDKTIRTTIAEESSTGVRAAEVEKIAMDTYFGRRNIFPDVIKINAEGAEHSILEGLEETINSFHPTIGVEVHPNHLKNLGSSCEDTLQLLHDHGYTLSLMGSGKGLPENETTDLCQGKSHPFGVIAKHN